MSITLLLADDHGVVRDGLRLLLEMQADMRVVGEAVSGREAVQKVKALRPDIAIVDIAMPELNGIEASRQMRKVSPDTQVIILSMYSTVEHIYQALQAGAQGYLMKENAGLEVVEAVRAVHAGRRYLCQKISDLVLSEYITQRESTGQRSPLERLSQREREILQQVVEGKSSAEIGALLSISSKTVETYRSRLMHKLGIHDVPGLVKFAIQHRITPLE